MLLTLGILLGAIFIATLAHFCMRGGSWDNISPPMTPTPKEKILYDGKGNKLT